MVVCVITEADVDKTTAAMFKHSTRDACNRVAGRKSRERGEKAGRGERKGGG